MFVALFPIKNEEESATNIVFADKNLNMGNAVIFSLQN